MARANMANLIARMRVTVDDLTSPQALTDDNIQTIFDTHRTRLMQEPFYGAGRTLGLDAGFSYLEYRYHHGDWEEGVIVYRPTFVQLTPGAQYNFNAIEGVVDTVDDEQDPYWLVTGYYYDYWATAADVAEELAAKLKLQYGFAAGTGAGSATRSAYKKYEQTLLLAERLRAKVKPKFVPAGRDDLGG